MADPLLSVRNLRVEIATRRGTLLAVDDASFDIAEGEVLGVVGESGAGKSIAAAQLSGCSNRHYAMWVARSGSLAGALTISPRSQCGCCAGAISARSFRIR